MVRNSPNNHGLLGQWSQGLRALSLGLCLLIGCAVQAQDHITARAWLEDLTGQLTWPQVTQQPLQTFDGVLSQGFGTGVIWIRLRIDPSAHPLPKRRAEQLILRIRPVYLDDVQIFDPLSPDVQLGATGDYHHPRNQPLEGPDFLWPIKRGDAPRDIWLRVSSTSTRQIAVQALNSDDLQRLSQIQDLMFGLYIGVILIFMVWGGVYWLFSREQLIGAFGIKQAAALIFALSTLGFTRVFWPAHWSVYWLDTTTTLSALVGVSTAVYFHVILLREYDPPQSMVLVHRLLLSLLPVKLLILFVVQQPMLALRINMVEVLLAPFIFVLTALTCRVWKKSGAQEQPVLARWVVVGFYTLLNLILVMAGLTGLGLVKGGEVPLYVVQAHGLITAFLVLLMLQYRAHIKQKHQRDNALKLEQSLLQTLQERSIREEQEKLLAMLAHELKTPLATMSMRLDANAPAGREMRRAIRDMNSVIERCQQTAQFSDRQLQANKHSVDLTELIQEVMASGTQPHRVQLRGPESLITETDRQLLFIVLSNLVLTQ